MARIDARRLAAFLDDPGACRVVLLHGDDPGLVRERAERLAARVTGGDALRLVEVPREAARDPGLLAAEAATLALVGGRRLVRVREASDAFAAAAKEALAGPGPGLVLLEAGELPARSRLRALLEPAPEAVVIPCYRERGAELAASIARLLAELEVQAEPAAVEWLAQRLGEDRLLLRRELEKLAAYVGAGGRVTQEDALACVAEGSALDLEEALVAALGGEVAAADRALETALAEGASPVQVVRAAMRQVQRLHLAALAVAGGTAPGVALEGLRPPVFFRHKPGLERALRRWRPEALEAAGAALLEAERRTKATGLPAATIARAAVLALARQAAR
ncbi:DNA polymerase III subunit delta [Crenalkalicoccus roseus]|uniref:DNA polymerase III subunit delta n=1 Tax=Crenalkalicoccus roseus TaxID=1485588 RepID=UPI0010819230|nr:DNA polymerase III subunit delta [Crenalkalicoccus roseus]